MKTLLKRTFFGAIYVGIILVACLCYVPYCFGVIFLLLSVLSVQEFHKITHADQWLTMGAMALTAILHIGIWTWACLSPLTVFANSVWILTTYAALLLLLMVSELFRPDTNPFEVWGNILIGQIFVALPFALMNILMSQSNLLLLSLFIVIWINDTGAYCVGSLLGKHKMIPRISPGKSWEGLAGGILFGLVAGYILFIDPFHITNLNYTWWQGLILTLVILIFGTLGDLIESLMKRTLGIKDSGNVLPGHGGFLDRFDSILLATIALSIALIALN